MIPYIIAMSSFHQLKTEHPGLYLFIVTASIIAIAMPAYAIVTIIQWWKKRKRPK